MTREEAKDYIREWCPYDRQDEIIKALSNSDEDCISRKQALEEINKTVFCYTHQARQIIKDLPSVQPIRPKGKWIEHEHEVGVNWEFSKYECSLCHEWHDYDSDFCPNCGADMRESKNK